MPGCGSARCGGHVAQPRVTTTSCDHSHALTSLEPILAPGTVLGNYRLVSLLGTGASCLVYVAVHEQIGRRVALKLLRASYAGDERLVRRFVDEARAINRIRHEHIIEVTDLGRHKLGPYFVMELLEGAPMDRVLRQQAPLPVGRSLRIGRQIAEAMSAAHEAGIVHRDLKPENIFLVARGEDPDFVKVLDFGLAKVADGWLQASFQTRTLPGTLVGTPAYMAPEQARGEAVDHLTDVYALGIVLYEMLLGRRPFGGDRIHDVIAGHLWRTPPAIAEAGGHEIDPELAELVMRCLAKGPRNRPPSMRALADALGRIDARLARRAPCPTGPPTQQPRRADATGPGPVADFDGEVVASRSRRTTFALGAAGLLALAGLALGGPAHVALATSAASSVDGAWSARSTVDQAAKRPTPTRRSAAPVAPRSPTERTPPGDVQRRSPPAERTSRRAPHRRRPAPRTLASAAPHRRPGARSVLERERPTPKKPKLTRSTTIDPFVGRSGER